MWFAWRFFLFYYPVFSCHCGVFLCCFFAVGKFAFRFIACAIPLNQYQTLPLRSLPCVERLRSNYWAMSDVLFVEVVFFQTPSLSIHLDSCKSEKQAAKGVPWSNHYSVDCDNPNRYWQYGVLHTITGHQLFCQTFNFTSYQVVSLSWISLKRQKDVSSNQFCLGSVDCDNMIRYWQHCVLLHWTERSLLGRQPSCQTFNFISHQVVSLSWISLLASARRTYLFAWFSWLWWSDQILTTLCLTTLDRE